MQFETKFSNGDKVYYPTSRKEIVNFKICEKCKGVGRLELVCGDTIRCTACHGMRGHSDSIYLAFPSKLPSLIGKISVEIYGVPSKTRENTVKYMLKDTGIGSGQCHYEDELFLTLEECEEYCKKENESVLSKFKEDNNTSI